ncbi:hypothetical protein Ctha_2203 [Chloroherpeton thalassium ATCC 35110]|uniref:Uncharacterized protein n=1 Tax=Chloroherpeton thalassium (strain ATCC 35110 / GB-78) TaxID=517418 RepID=B3QW00_CHLT3|nr:hypothetical protein [Chloroherpeton thalassium]ACF14654.1 hypothetical protein Ctha_2203 [Chloroherpeton thalassium ATCC 35110]
MAKKLTKYLPVMVSEDIANWYEAQAELEGQPKAVLLRNALRTYKEIATKPDMGAALLYGKSTNATYLSNEDKNKLRLLSEQKISYQELEKILNLHKTISEHFSSEQADSRSQNETKNGLPHKYHGHKK